MEKYFSAVEKNHDIILNAYEYIWKNPETGYREVKTSKYLETEFERLGYELTKAGNIPGFCTVIDTGRPGPELLILGEMDSLICPEHPESDPKTGALHCCGHCAQSAALLGIAAALKEPGVLDELSGRIRLCAVPAEELIEIEYRTQLRNEGRIKYFGGKSEFLSRGMFDGVDLAFMVHTTVNGHILIRKGAVGCVAKTVAYKGVSAHAGGSPWAGCNALYAASNGLSAINAIRETFKESDLIRVHPIIKQGGGAVNAIPDNVVIESYVRGASFDAIYNANRKVNRALTGSALSIGANVEINDTPGYSPLLNSTDMADVAYEAAQYIEGVNVVRNDSIGTGSTDMGDLSAIMPVVHPYMPGATGTSHGSNYFISDPELACIGSAKWQMAMIHLLLSDGAKRARTIVDNFKPIFASKEEYFEYINKFESSGKRITYNDDQTATVKL